MLPALATGQGVPTSDVEQEIVITGFRQSLATSQQIKREASEVVDAVVAEDIGKLPDNNLSEALQRIPGVQITRNHGEGSGIAIRGLTQVKTLLNGREIYSDTGRDLSLENVPAEILSGVTVYKNPSASLVEGGLGGVVDLKTRMPFDFNELTASVSARGNHYDLLDDVKPQVSALVSNRWDVGSGELGVLFGAAYLQSGGRFDQIGVEPFADRYDIVDFDQDGFFPGNNTDPGDLVIAPRGGGNSIEITDRDRIALNTTAQWRANDRLELFVEGTYNEYEYHQDAYVVFANRGALAPLPGASWTFYEGTNVVRTGAYRDVQFTSNTNFFDRDAYTWQAAVGGKLDLTSAFRLSADVSYTRSEREDTSGSLRIGNPTTATGTTLVFDTSTDLPTLQLQNFNAGDPGLYSYINANHNLETTEGSGQAARVDGIYEFESSFIKSALLGLRYASRDVGRRQGGQNHINQNRPGSQLPEGLTGIPFGNFFDSTRISQVIGVFGPPAAVARDIERQCAAFGDPVCHPAYNPLNTYEQAEDTATIYGQLDFEVTPFGLPVRGNLGLRYVETALSVDGFRTSTTGTSQPISQDTDYSNVLPSFNARVQLRPDLFVRFAAADQLTRPNFGDLSPNLNLATQTVIGLTGRAGNPDLRPLESRSYDLGLEWYFNENGNAYVAAFRKEVDGFIQTVTRVEPVSLPDYPQFTTAEITRPQNGDDGTIDGGEVGVQTFFDFLPSPWDGFGLQANFTYVDSSAPGPIAGTAVPLVGLSTRSYNAVLFYEKHGFRARMAYNWRDDFVETTSGPGSGSLPIYTKPYGVLDASLGYHVNDHVDISLDASNLTRARYSTYFGEQIRPRFNNIFDRRVGLVIRAKL